MSIKTKIVIAKLASLLLYPLMIGTWIRYFVRFGEYPSPISIFLLLEKAFFDAASAYLSLKSWKAESSAQSP